MATATVSASETIDLVVVHVRFDRATRVRLWLGVRLMKLAALVAGCGVEIETGDPA